MKQKEIREKYEKTIAFIDNRLENQIAVCKANSDIDMLSISIALSGFIYDEEITGVQNKI
ncbi:TPA: hypothetical protein QCX88_005359 [Bacillus wiedmannii]|uniref:hypothetical protein n=1 Tax=Bacillus wiedmannii TaxID=1890302 RepID=UPI0021D0215A|nr:hypothetical protein [Bacillus wiedmannii]MCU5577859.1 hypothetical protein [Bacillus wiedmannii]HDR7677149.1 hypothetical protein [Bacillus wiedmannii]